MERFGNEKEANRKFPTMSKLAQSSGEGTDS